MILTKGQIVGADPHVQPDDRDQAILEEKISEMEELIGPRVGDFVIFSDGVAHRFSYDWDGSLQTSEGGSFYLGRGHVSFSGGLNPPIPKTKLVDTGETKIGRVWFFHHNFATAHNGVNAEVEFKVYKTELKSDHWEGK